VDYGDARPRNKSKVKKMIALGQRLDAEIIGGLAERWIASCRREILDHVIALNEEQLSRILREYIRYYHDDRLHD
jgi:hypothetical protein